MKKIALSFMIIMMICSQSFASDSIRVKQPAYDSMSFYVHRPANLPKGFYVTYDGYIVYKNERGIWHYGSAESKGITKTNYIVGSVIPSVVNLRPYNEKISSVAPILNASAPVVIGRPVPFGEASAPGWTGNSNFMAIAKWRNSVDRIGVTGKPSIPVAWKGDYPEVIYAWTGLRWKQLDANVKNISAVSTLRRELYNLTVEVNKTNMLRWTDYDSRVLAQYANQWGYKWIGIVIADGRIR